MEPHGLLGHPDAPGHHPVPNCLIQITARKKHNYSLNQMNVYESL